MKKVAIVGVPIDTTLVLIDYESDYYVPLEVLNLNSTVAARKMMIEVAKNISNLETTDFGELTFGIESPKTREFKVEIRDCDKDYYDYISLDTLKTVKDDILSLKKEFDYVICTGPSHFGALLLYEPDDFVARFDFHGDFIAERSDLVVGENYASYMNTVKRDIKPKRIFNYGWGGLNSIEKAYAMDLCGELGFVGDNNHLQANHFDIDVDCFRNDLKMSKYHHCGNLLPKQVETMISEVKPKKIGVWEYRPFFDRGNGVKFLETLIQSL